MPNDDQRTLAANLLLERVEMKRDITQIKAELTKRAEAMVRLGTVLRSNPQAVNLDEQEMTSDYAQRAQKFNSDDFDVKRVAELVNELRSKSDRLAAAEQQIKGMGYPLD